ncbi:LSM domain-containing protein [Cavenderia fasciculata]|uniref:U6 snRNA-associated Sm-like protein LSm8 n=1 Tax=Cavenderia fasciculata TaxID=261658 RepID=F4QEC3_CACFS|nr:LSM domain-containing protein [Cavenderia fasciculata]EGG14070.1 LSM domain-containing protein [Cavenderia fasciculata]|eukprot:XP_004350778.1 LSM domain-containing protein [Cavenderia fasciculata]
MSLLEQFFKKQVLVLTADGRNIVGTLIGLDQTTNIILEKCHERIYSPDEGVTKYNLGIHLIKGDDVAVIGEIDQELDAIVVVVMTIDKFDIEKKAAASLDPPKQTDMTAVTVKTAIKSFNKCTLFALILLGTFYYLRHRFLTIIS